MSAESSKDRIYLSVDDAKLQKSRTCELFKCLFILNFYYNGVVYLFYRGLKGCCLRIYLASTLNKMALFKCVSSFTCD